LLRSLMAYLRGEPKVWSVVRVPSVAEENDRRLHRERGRLIGERIQHVNRIKGLLANHGIYDYQPLRSDRMQRLERLHTADGRQGGNRARIAAVGACPTNDQDDRGGTRCHCIDQAKMEHSNAKKIQDLLKIKCIGPEFAAALVSEVFYRSFDNRKQLAGYVGLTPSHFQSGPMRRDQGISKAGNTKARTTMVELQSHASY
jgi:transposase